MDVRLAGPGDIEVLVPLFDGYRQFYKFASNMVGARAFLKDRFDREDSTIFLASEGNRPVGFSQLYPSYSSGRMAPIFILNDLFVVPDARQHGAARALIEKARMFAKSKGAVRLTLSTAVDNVTAQGVYERTGWARDKDFYVYHLALT
jgi:GNAT superfamily N-acetyltransferase